MPTFKNNLDRLLADTVLCSKRERAVYLGKVRSYIAKTKTEKLKKEISEITSETELSMLQAAGVPRSVYDTFLLTVEKTTLKRGGK